MRFPTTLLHQEQLREDRSHFCKYRCSIFSVESQRIGFSIRFPTTLLLQEQGRIDHVSASIKKHFSAIDI